MKQGLRMRCRRITSGFLAFTMTAILVLGDAGAAFASTDGSKFYKDGSDLGGEGYSMATSSNASFKNHSEDEVVMSIFSSDDSDFRAGGTFFLDVHLKNETGTTITNGVLDFTGKKLRESGAYFEDPKEDVVSDGIIEIDEEPEEEGAGIQIQDLENDLIDGELDMASFDTSFAQDEEDGKDNAIEAGETGKKENKAEEKEEDEEELLQKLEGIELAPGQIYTARFVCEVDEDLEKAKNMHVNFRFRGETEEKKINKQEKFQYVANHLNMGEIRFEDGNEVKTGETVTMGIHTSMFDFDSILTNKKVEDELLASASNAGAATPSNAQTATPSNTDEDEEWEEEDNDDFVVDLGKVKYEIQMINAKLNDFEIRDALVSDANENMMVCSFRVSKKVNPGVYFGKVIQKTKEKSKTYTSSQGFALIVNGDGDVTLETKVEGSDAIVTVSGPVDSFPDADQLAVAAKEITVMSEEIAEDSDKMEQVQNAIEKKAQEENIDVKAFKALDIKLYADGQEVEPTGPIRVAFKNVKLEDKLASVEAAAEEATEEAAAEESKNPIAKLFEVFSADKGQKADEVVTAEEAVAKAAEENSESKVEVWHLPDESEEIGQTFEVSTDEETGDVVMDTDHFSIYIVVNTGLGGKDLKVHVEHWIDYNTIDGNATDASHVLLDTNTDDQGRRYGYYTKDDIYNRHTQTMEKKNHYRGKLYTPDEFSLPNGLEDQTIEGLSKVCLAKENKQWKNKNYWINEVWISNKTSNLNKQDWSGTVEKYYIERDKSTGNIVSVKNASGKNLGVNPKVTLTKDSVVRFWYKEKVVTEKYKQPVTFWDHNVGGTVPDGGGHNVGSNQGTNSSVNFTGSGRWKMGAGQPVSGNGSDWANTNKSPLGHLNKGNTADQATGITTGSGVERDYNNGYVIVKNEVKASLNSSGNLQYSDYIKQPKFFQETKSGSTYLTKQINGYNLGFKQEGDTYTLSTVYKGDGSEVSSINKLEKVKYSAHNNGSDTNIYSNEFWPLDDVESYPGKDSKGKGSDDGKAHNWHFAMRYDFGFKVGDYEGPINYYFRGDDDFWLFVDGKKIIDLGGIHSAVGESVDLRKVVDFTDREKEHKVSVFYMERGGYGSCCYMQFTIPNCSKSWPIPTVDKTSASVKKEWEDYSSPVRPTSIQVELVRREKRNNKPSSVVVVLDEKTLPINGKWEYTWDNLPVENVSNSNIKYIYEVREKGTPKGYIKSESTTNTITKIVNKLDPVKVNVTKTWNDDNDRDGNRPDKLKLELWWSKDGGKTWAVYPDSKAKVEVDVPKDSNSHTYTFSNLPKYSGNTEIQYRVYEMNGQSRLASKGATLTGNKGKNYTLDELKFDQADNGDVTAATSLKNSYVPETVERTVEKKWVDVPEYMENSIEVGLYEQDSTGLFQWEGGWEKPKNWQNPVTLKKDKNSSVKTATYTWTKLPKYRNHGTLIKYEIYELDKGQKIEGSGIHTFDGYNYKVEPGKQITYSENNGKVTVTNTLIKAKLRVVKFTEKNNLDKEGNEIDQKYKFLINVTEVNEGAERDYASLTLGQREDPEQYIEVIPTSTGKTFKIEEVVPMEYELVRMIGMTTSEWKNKAKGDAWVVNDSWQSSLQGFNDTVKAPSVKLMPGDDITVTVVNRPDHEGYFHHTYSVTNENAHGTGFYPIETNRYDEPHGNREADTKAPANPVAWLSTRDNGRKFGEEESLEGDEDLYA